jgi:hypothetical protein
VSRADGHGAFRLIKALSIDTGGMELGESKGGYNRRWERLKAKAAVEELNCAVVGSQRHGLQGCY